MLNGSSLHTGMATEPAAHKNKRCEALLYLSFAPAPDASEEAARKAAGKSDHYNHSAVIRIHRRNTGRVEQDHVADLDALEDRVADHPAALRAVAV